MAFGLSGGQAPDRFLVGLAVLSLLSEVARERPLVCLVDDAQWLDRASAQALAFVARRLLAESAALVFAVREPGGELAGLPELVVEGLGDADARALLASVIPGPLDERVRDRIVAETRGNPLALLELPRGVTPAELAGGFGLPDALPLSGRIEESFRRRLEALPADTRRLLLVAAAEPVGEPVLVWRAAERLGIGAEAAAPAATAGLLEFGARVRFRHPLVRSAVYRAASLEDRQGVHRALAEATDPEVDPDRRAWHRAQATPGPDEEVAAELERSAGRAQARGGLAAAAAFLERAAALTPEPARRAERALAAAQAKHQAGALRRGAASCWPTAEAGPLDELQRARVDLLRAQIAFAVEPRQRRSAAAAQGRQAARAARRRRWRARPTWRRCPRRCSPAVWPAAAVCWRWPRPRARRPRPRSPRARPISCWTAWPLLITEGYAAGAPMLKRALSAFRSERLSGEEELRWLWLACHAAVICGTTRAWDVLSTRHVQLARDAGALTVLPIALTTRVGVHLLAGEFAAAASLVEEAEAVTEATGSQLAPYGALVLAALAGPRSRGLAS